MWRGANVPALLPLQWPRPFWPMSCVPGVIDSKLLPYVTRFPGRTSLCCATPWGAGSCPEVMPAVSLLVNSQLSTGELFNTGKAAPPARCQPLPRLVCLLSLSGDSDKRRGRKEEGGGFGGNTWFSAQRCIVTACEYVNIRKLFASLILPQFPLYSACSHLSFGASQVRAFR